MAISQNFLTGRMKKSAGTVRFSTWKGLNVVAAKPISVRQNVTPAVELNRQKMSAAGKLGSKMAGFAKIAYNFGIQKTTPFADQVKFFRTKMLDNLKLDGTKLRSSSYGTGNISVAAFTAAIDNASEVGLTIIEPFSYNIFTDDECLLVAVSETMDDFKISAKFKINSSSVMVDFSDSQLIPGNKYCFALKPIKYSPGNDLAGKVKFSDNANFELVS